MRIGRRNGKQRGEMVNDQFKPKWAETLNNSGYSSENMGKSESHSKIWTREQEAVRWTESQAAPVAPQKKKKKSHFKSFHAQKLFIGSQVVLMPYSSEIHLAQSLWGGITHQTPVQLHFIFTGLDGNSGQRYNFK